MLLQLQYKFKQGSWKLKKQKASEEFKVWNIIAKALITYRNHFMSIVFK